MPPISLPKLGLHFGQFASLNNSKFLSKFLHINYELLKQPNAVFRIILFFRFLFRAFLFDIFNKLARWFNHQQSYLKKIVVDTAQKMRFAIKDFFSKCDKIRRKLRIWSHLLNKSLMEILIFCALWKRSQRSLRSLFKSLLYWKDRSQKRTFTDIFHRYQHWDLTLSRSSH